MSLSTKTGTSLGQTVVTDVNANVGLSSGSARQVSPELAILFNKSIVAKPLTSPEVCSIHVKNLEYQYRWVNRHAKGGLMYQQRRSQGFTNATTEDVQVLGGDAAVTNGEITAFDLILMKIQRDRYDAAIKFNTEKAFALTRARGVYMEGGSPDVMSDAAPKRMSVAQEPFSRSDKATPFIPANADSIIDDSVRTGRVDGARAAVDEIRAKAKKD